MISVLRDRLRVSHALNVEVIGLEQAPEAYRRFSAGGDINTHSPRARRLHCCTEICYDSLPHASNRSMLGEPVKFVIDPHKILRQAGVHALEEKTNA